MRKRRTLTSKFARSCFDDDNDDDDCEELECRTDYITDSISILSNISFVQKSRNGPDKHSSRRRDDDVI